MKSIRDRLAAAREKDYVSIQELALLVGVSERTVWRRLPQLGQIIRNGHITRVNRRQAVRYFLNL